MARPKRDLTKISLNLPSHVLQKIDDYALKLGISRTTAIMILCVDGIVKAESESIEKYGSIWDEENQRHI